MSPVQPESGTHEFSCVPCHYSTRISLLPTKKLPSLKICVVWKPPTVGPRHDASLQSSFNRPQRNILTAGSDTPPHLLCSLVKNMFPCVSPFFLFFFLQSFLPFADCLQHVLCVNVYVPYKKKNMWAQN